MFYKVNDKFKIWASTGSSDDKYLLYETDMSKLKIVGEKYFAKIQKEMIQKKTIDNK